MTSDAVGTSVSIAVAENDLLISTNNFPQAIDYTVGTVSGGSLTTLPAEPAVVVLEEFAALHLTSAVLDGAYDFTFTIAEGNPSFYAVVPGMFDAQNSTVADLLEYLNGLSPEVGATLTDAGIEIFSTRTGADVTLTVNRFELSTVNAGSGAALSDVVGAVNYVTGNETFSIEAAVPGTDPLLVSGISYATEDTERTSVKQVVEFLFFGDGTVDSLAVGSTVTLNLGAVSVSYTVTGQESGDLSTAIASALASQLNTNHKDLVSAMASILTGYTDTSLITLTAAVTGPNILGSVDDSTLSVSITGPSGASITAAALSETVAGEVYFTTSGDSVFIYDETGESEVARTGADRGTLAYDDSSYTLNGATLEQGSPFETLLDIDDAAVTGEADDPKDQSLSNPIDDASFYGDASQLGADDKGVLSGEGVSQSFTNPGDAYVATSGSAATGTSGSGDATYYGDAALLGEDEEGKLTGDGVLQSFTNPDSEYLATSGSPVSGTVDTSEDAGDAAFFGDAALEGSIDTQTGVLDGLGVDQTYTNPSSGYDRLPGSPEFNDASANAGDSELDGSNPGKYLDDGLYSSYLNGATPRDAIYRITLPNSVGWTAETVLDAGIVDISIDGTADTIIRFDYSLGDTLGAFLQSIVDSSETDAITGYSISDTGGVSILLTQAASLTSVPELAYTILSDVEGVLGNIDFSSSNFYPDEPASLVATLTQYVYDVDRLDIGDGSVTDDGGLTGESETTITDETASDDVFKVVQTEKGFAFFDWDESTVTIQSTASTGPDVVNNFQAGGVTTVEFTWTGDAGYSVVGRFTYDPAYAYNGEHPYGAGPLVGAWTGEGSSNFGILDMAVSIYSPEKMLIGTYDQVRDNGDGIPDASDIVYGDLNFAYVVQTGEIVYGPNGFDIGFYYQQEQNYLWDNGFGLNLYIEDLFVDTDTSSGPLFDVVVQGKTGDVIALEGDLAASTFYDGTVDEIVDIEVIEAISGFLKSPELRVAFDLSANEFGLVSSSANRVLDASSIRTAEDVAGLLNSVFDFGTLLGGTTDNGSVNTTIFAVTASDDASVTAIWAHTQSSFGDSTVEHVELNLLATVNTIDGEFGRNNLDILQSQPVI